MKKIGYGNLMSALSLLLSMTCFVIMTRILYQDAINRIDPDKKTIQTNKTFNQNQTNINEAEIFNQPNNTQDNLINDDIMMLDDELFGPNKPSQQTVQKQDYKYLSQLGEFQTHSEAVAAWFKLAGQHPAAITGLRYTISKSNDGILYYLQVPSGDRNEAERVCIRMNQYKMPCRIISH